MTRGYLAFAFTFLVLFQVAFAQDKPSIVSSLRRYQAANGGFKLNEGDSATTLEATSYALFLNALYYLGDKINTESALRYVQSLENGDFGYGPHYGSSSDLESVRHALLSFTNLNAPIPNAVNLAGYIQNLYHSDSGLFGNKVGVKADLKATANAVQSLKLLSNAGNDASFLKKITPSIHQLLKKIQKDTADGSHFSDSTYPALTANYYGLLLATLTGYDIQDPAKFVAYIASQQSKDGGFYADNKKTTSYEVSGHAAASLHLLKKVKEGLTFSDKINSDALYAYAKKSGNDLKSTFASHLIAVVLDKALTFTPSYEADTRSGLADDRIVQGAKVRPGLFVSSVVGFSNPLFTVDVTAALPSGSQSLKAEYSDRKYITSDSVNTANQLGSAKFTYKVAVNLAELSGYTVNVVDNKQIGYGVTVAAHASLSGKEIREGDTIGVGTEFKFGVSLHNQTHESLNSGDFEIILNVLDSSRVTIHTQTVDGRQNKDAVSFAYTLKTASIPSGELIFSFEVKGKEGVHTTKSVVYTLPLLMVATEINFGTQQPKYKLGDTVKVTMVPGTFPDLRTVNTFSTKESEKRVFFMDVSSTGGAVVHSIKGVADAASKDALKLTFTLPLDATIENIGTKVISFRYVTASHKEVALSNYDSAVKELYEETPVSFTVNAELRAVNIQERPAKGDFFYGNDITYKFQIKDTVSGKFVLAGKNPAANVFLELKNQQAGKDRTYVSASQAATISNDNSFLIQWNINPNAVRGAGVLSVVVHNVDGEVIPLSEEKSNDPIQLNVNIGGDIDVSSNFKTFSTETQKAEFLAEFTLKCQGKTLKDAQLRAVVSYRSGSDQSFTDLYVLPVANDESGKYETSWVVPHTQAPSGEYRLQFFREVDKTADKPLFEFSTVHTAVPTSQLPVKTEFLVTLLFGAAFASLAVKKSKY